MSLSSGCYGCNFSMREGKLVLLRDGILCVGSENLFRCVDAIRHVGSGACLFREVDEPGRRKMLEGNW